MQENFAIKLKRVVSEPRFEGYKRRVGNNDDFEIYSHYVWNIALSESLYAPLQALEVTLRNAIHGNASIHFSNEFWFDNRKIISNQRQVEKIRNARIILKKHNKSQKSGRILSELSFGFWTSLFNSEYEQILWPPLIKKTFPNLPKRIRTRKTLSKRFNKLRRLRNRIFHFEPIWYYRDLKDQHDEILEAIQWIEPEMRKLIETLDNFPDCYNNGLQNIKDKLKPSFQN